jgi:hypothetical protein
LAIIDLGIFNHHDIPLRSETNLLLQERIFDRIGRVEDVVKLLELKKAVST